MAESGKRVFWNEDCVHSENSQSVSSSDFIFFWAVEGSVRWRELERRLIDLWLWNRTIRDMS